MSTEALSALLVALQRRARFGMVLGLGATERALAAVGSPQLDCPAVHIAGSNGKGSVSAMVESIARAAGLRTGLYTSPHLSRFAERIRIGGEPIGDAAFERALSLVFERCSAELTFFETLTVAAFVAFREAKVDLAVLEVGLGGRLDATNVIPRPLATAVSSIALEHTQVLGGTIEQIAREKAGILKPGVPLVVAPMQAPASRTIDQVAREVGAGPVVHVVRHEGATEPSPHDICVWTEHGELRIAPPASSGHAPLRATPSLRGPHQGDNAAVAAGLAWQLVGRFPSIAHSIEAGLRLTRWPGRLERILQGSVVVLIDCAHNPEGATALAQALPGEGARRETTTLVFGALADKSWRQMLGILAPLAHRKVYTTAPGREAIAPRELSSVSHGEAITSPREALANVIASSPPGETIVVAGSSYLAGELRAALLGIEADPVIAL